MVRSSLNRRTNGSLRELTQREQLLRGLLQGLVSFWDGSGGSCGADPVGGNFCVSGSVATPATDMNGDTLGAISTLQYLMRASGSLHGLDFHTGDFTVGQWFRTTNSNQGLLARWAISAGARKWATLVEGGAAGFVVSTDGSTIAAYPQTATNKADGANHCLLAWRDTTGDKIWIRLDNGTPISAAFSGAASLYTGAADLYMGSLTSTVYTGEGNMARCGIWSRILTDAEQAAYYNNGTGLTLRNIFEGK